MWGARLTLNCSLLSSIHRGHDLPTVIGIVSVHSSYTPGRRSEPTGTDTFQPGPLEYTIRMGSPPLPLPAGGENADRGGLRLPWPAWRRRMVLNQRVADTRRTVECPTSTLAS